MGSIKERLSILGKVVSILAFAAIAVLFSFGAGRVTGSTRSKAQLQRVVAMSWGDGKYANAYYGAHVYLEPLTNGFSVRARVLIGRGNHYYHDCGELGRVAEDADAVARWGRIEWREDGLHIGTETNHYFLARAEIENHR